MLFEEKLYAMEYRLLARTPDLPEATHCMRAIRPTEASKATVRYVRSTSTPVIFDAEPIVRFSLLGRQRSISGSTRGGTYINPDVSRAL